MLPEVAVGIPAELLRRWLDIRFADHWPPKVPKSGFAKADLFPDFFFFRPELGLSKQRQDRSPPVEQFGFGDLVKKNSITYTTGAGFNWDIFNYGRITNQVRVEDARFQELAVMLNRPLIRAAQDVEEAMVSFLQSQDAVFFWPMPSKHPNDP